MLYLITVEENDSGDFGTGVLMGKQTASSPEHATVKMAKQALDGDIRGLTQKSFVGLMQHLYVNASYDSDSAEMRVYPVATSPEEDKEYWAVDELDFESDSSMDMVEEER